MLTNVLALLLLLLVLLALLLLLLVFVAELALDEALADWPLKVRPSLMRDTLLLDVADEAFALISEAALPGADDVLVVKLPRWFV